MNKNNIFPTLLLMVMMSFTKSMSAQVTIGSGKPPNPFALLDLCTTEQKKGLHNARMTTAQRDMLVTPNSPLADREEARGLVIFNITNNCLEFFNGKKWVSLCAPAEITESGSRLTAFVNVMYDFQQQELKAFVTEGNGKPSSWQWQMRVGNTGEWKNIAGATTSTFKIPANFIHQQNLNDFHTEELYFRCLLSNSASKNIATNELGILFINTANAGNNNGVRYFEMNIADRTVPNRTIDVALLNLGASEDDRTGSMGGFFQWGSSAEQEHTNWSKVGSGNTVINPASNWSSSTSGEWGIGRLRHEVSDWTDNNPCPDGWRVPSRFDLGDMHNSKGTETGSCSFGSEISCGLISTTWRWRPMNEEAQAFGGMLITNHNNGAVIFLPAAGYRAGSTGAFGTSVARGGLRGNYWTSSAIDDDMQAFDFHFNAQGIVIGAGGQERANGFSIRCVR